MRDTTGLEIRIFGFPVDKYNGERQNQSIEEQTYYYNNREMRYGCQINSFLDIGNEWKVTFKGHCTALLPKGNSISYSKLLRQWDQNMNS